MQKTWLLFLFYQNCPVTFAKYQLFDWIWKYIKTSPQATRDDYRNEKWSMIKHPLRMSPKWKTGSLDNNQGHDLLRFNENDLRFLQYTWQQVAHQVQDGYCVTTYNEYWTLDCFHINRIDVFIHIITIIILYWTLQASMQWRGRCN